MLLRNPKGVDLQRAQRIMQSAIWFDRLASTRRSEKGTPEEDRAIKDNGPKN
jgi:hypothetical protein